MTKRFQILQWGLSEGEGNYIEQVMGAHDDRGFLKEFLKLGFMRKRIKERQLVDLFAQIGWEYRIMNFFPPEGDDPELYMTVRLKTNKINVNVKSSSTTRVWCGVKFLIQKRHEEWRSKKFKVEVSREKRDYIASSFATMAVIPPAEMISLYRKLMRDPVVSDVVQEFNVVEPIAVNAIELFNHYYTKNPHRDRSRELLFPTTH